MDVVAFRDKDNQLSVKRIVAMPGEHVAIRCGDLFINGAICRKSLECQRRLVILVHDSRYLPKRNRTLPARWERPHGERLVCRRRRLLLRGSYG